MLLYTWLTETLIMAAELQGDTVVEGLQNCCLIKLMHTVDQVSKHTWHMQWYNQSWCCHSPPSFIRQSISLIPSIIRPSTREYGCLAATSHAWELLSPNQGASACIATQIDLHRLYALA